MYTVKVRDHVMIAHSLKNETFGPAQNLHGSTYIVDAEFQCDTLDEQNIVIDIGLSIPNCSNCNLGCSGQYRRSRFDCRFWNDRSFGRKVIVVVASGGISNP